MAKIKDVTELLESIGIKIPQYESTIFRNRYVRMSENGYLDIGEDINTFNKFGDSTELTFDLYSKKGQRALLRWVDTFV